MCLKRKALSFNTWPLNRLCVRFSLLKLFIQHTILDTFHFRTIKQNIKDSALLYFYKIKLWARPNESMHLVSLKLSVKLIVWIANCSEPSKKHRISNMWMNVRMAKRQVKHSLHLCVEHHEIPNPTNTVQGIVWKYFAFWTILVVKNGSYAICENSRESLSLFLFKSDSKIKTTTFKLT